MEPSSIGGSGNWNPAADCTARFPIASISQKDHASALSSDVEITDPSLLEGDDIPFETLFFSDSRTLQHPDVVNVLGWLAKNERGTNPEMNRLGGTFAEAPWTERNETKSSQVENCEGNGVSFAVSRRTPSCRLREMLQEAEDMSDYLFERSVDCLPCMSSFVSADPSYYRRPVPQSELDVSETTAAATEVRRQICAPHSAGAGLSRDDPFPWLYADTDVHAEQENVSNSTGMFSPREALATSSSEPRVHWSLRMPKSMSSRGDRQLTY
eukprot:GHVS01028087.1.p1 GENE.GHVS01028087.1~~GHVS01028087.1.p1  ORF type:complete len:269 (+),score=8.51 GHVS01028087.1:120-926(+)